MKRIYFFLIFCLTTGLVFAQEGNGEYRSDEFKTIFGGRSVGGYGGIGVGYTTIASRQALVFDARGGVILGHSLAIGFGGAGFINEYEENTALNKEVSMVGGYGGIFIEPILLPKFPVHLSFPVLVGIGGAAYTSFVKENDNGYTDENNVEETSSAFFVLEPSAELEFNFTRWLRMAAFMSYRYTSDLEMNYTQPDALSTYTAGVRFKFGKF